MRRKTYPLPHKAGSPEEQKRVAAKKQMPRKRERVEPNITVYHGNAGDTYEAHFQYRLDDGTLHREAKSFRTIEEAQDALAYFKAKARWGCLPTGNGNITVKDYMYLYLEVSELSPTTVQGYHGIIRRVSQYPLGVMKVNQVKKMDVERFRKEVQKKEPNLSPQTINRNMTFLSAVFQMAEDNDIISKNPAHGIKALPTPNKKQGKCLTDEELKKLHETTEREDIQNRLIVSMGLYLGLRRAEMAGMRWEDIDFDRQKVTICNTRTKAEGKIIEKPTKTNRARTIPLDNCMELIREMQQWQAENGQCNYVLAGRGGKALSPDKISKIWQDFRGQAGMPDYRLYDLRHTACSIMCRTAEGIGKSVADVALMMGHSDMNTTLRYYAHGNEQSFDVMRSIGGYIDSIKGENH